MANEKRKRQAFIGGLVEDNPLLVGGLTLTSASLAAIAGGVGSTEHMAVVIDPDGYAGAPEVAYITALTAGAGSATIARGQEGTSARQHERDTPWLHGATPRDFVKSRKTVLSDHATYSVTVTSKTAIDASNLPFLTLDCEVGDVIELTLMVQVNTSGGGSGFLDFEIDQPTSANTWACPNNDGGCASWTNQSGPVTAYAVFVVTERGNHGFRPACWRSGGTSVQLENAVSGATDKPITFTVRNLGPEAAA